MNPCRNAISPGGGRLRVDSIRLSAVVIDEMVAAAVPPISLEAPVVRCIFPRGPGGQKRDEGKEGRTRGTNRGNSEKTIHDDRTGRDGLREINLMMDVYVSTKREFLPVFISWKGHSSSTFTYSLRILLHNERRPQSSTLDVACSSP